ncbi:MAG: cysteine desulfurase NifS [Chlamydiales bacterium]
MSSKIYLDHNAGTHLAPEVLEVMETELRYSLGNPSSVHAFGQETRNRITKARRTIADYLGVSPSEIYFTSGGTESLNLAIRSLFSNNLGHIITSNVEHACVASIVHFLEKQGCRTTYLEAGAYGTVTDDQVESAVEKDTKAIILIAANNETGVMLDIESVAAVAERRNIPLIIDAVSLMGKEVFSIPAGVSAMAFSAHKFHGPRGVGFLYARRNFPLKPLIIGGGQEKGLRGGTENVLGIVGMAKAVELIAKNPQAVMYMRNLRNHLEYSVQQSLDHVILNGRGPRVSNTVNLSFPGVDGDSLLMNLDLAGIAVSHGSACSSGSLEPSRILLNMGVPMDIARTSIRFSLSHYMTHDEINRCVEILVSIVKRLRSIANI